MKTTTWRSLTAALMLLSLTACDGFMRSCSSGIATEFGGDWVVVELTEAGGLPYRCWMLSDVSLSSEEGSDGIYWQAEEGHLVHVAGSYDFVQVQGGDWERALSEINMTKDACETIAKRRFNPATNAYE